MTTSRSAHVWQRLRRSRWLVAAVGVLVAVVVAVGFVVVTPSSHQPAPSALPLRISGELALPGDHSRFDYASLDADGGLLFIAHLGAGEVLEVDVRAHRVVRTIRNLPQVHGVLVVPALHRVYATATGSNLVVGLDEDTGEVLTRTPTGEYPDGLAYDPRRGAIWTTNETGGSETVIDAVTGAARGTVALGGEVGNVAYDLIGDQMLVAVHVPTPTATANPATTAAAGRRRRASNSGSLPDTTLVTARQTKARTWLRLRRVRHAEEPDLGEVRRRMENDSDLTSHGPYAVLYAIMDKIVDDYFPVLDGLQNDIDEIEVQVFGGDPGVPKRIYTLSREVIEFQRAIEPLEMIFDELRGRLKDAATEPDLELRRALRDVADHAARVRERTTAFRQLLGNILQVNSALVGQRQTRRWPA
jgi:hypothetical protein